jgi:hypothetical protein
MPGLGGANQSGIPGAQILPRWTFSLCGYIKNITYSENIRGLRHLWDRITAAIATVTPDMIQQTSHKIEHRLDIYQATNGSHISKHAIIKSSDIS